VTPRSSSAGLSSGAALFARYADAPNALGYCGPPEGIGTTEAEIRASARRFSGVWPYLEVLARLTGTADPLDARLVEAYWLGRDLGPEFGIDRETFGRELLAVLGPKAGAYWTHLTPDLLAEAAPDHGFHVFGVYPWSRLLAAGPQPLFVLDSCRIRWGTVVGLDPLTFSSPRLTWDGTALGLGDPTEGPVEGNGANPGDTVAVHWDRLVDRLTGDQAEVLEASTRTRLTLTNRRLA
jgi:uncharacterized protein DUF6390